MNMSTLCNCAEAFTLYNVQKYTKVCNFQNTDWWALWAGLVAIAWLAVLRTWLGEKPTPDPSLKGRE